MSTQAAPQTVTTTPHTGSARAVTEAGHPRRWSIMAVLGAVAFMAQLDFFVVNVALDGIGQSFPGTNVASVSWVLSAYAIVFAAVLVAQAGRIADQWGRKKMLLSGVALFTLTSAVAAAAPSLGVLVAARAVQAVGAAMIVPTSLGLLYPSFPKRQHTLVVGLWAGVGAIAASAGPPVGGLLVTLDWRWIFLINVPVGIATLISRRAAPARGPPAQGRRPAGPGLRPRTAAGREPAGARHRPGTGVGLDGHPHRGPVRRSRPGLRRHGRAHPARQVTGDREAALRRQAVHRRHRGPVPFSAGLAIVLLSTALFMQEVWHFSPLRAGVSIAPAPLPRSPSR